MNLPECAQFVQLIDVARPNYNEWRLKKAAELSKSHGMTTEAAMSQMLRSIATELESVTPDEAQDVIEAVQSGQFATSFWSDFPAESRAFVKQLRSQRAASARYQSREDEPRYNCLDCRDSGVVVVFNGFFVREFRATFAAMNGKCPRDFRQQCTAFARINAKNHCVPLTHVGLCNCSCRRQMILAAELDKFLSGNRKGGQPPACGTFRWKPEICPVHPDGTNQSMFDALKKWYVDHPGDLF